MISRKALKVQHVCAELLSHHFVGVCGVNASLLPSVGNLTGISEKYTTTIRA